MSKSSLKISDTEMHLLRQAADLHSRSLAGQAEHWMRLGRLVEQSPSFTHPDVARALAREITPEELPLSVQEEYFDRLGDMMTMPSAEEERFFAEMRRRGGAVGDAGAHTAEIVTLPPESA
jgi:ParD-like antitoxin of type II bacterial toxin-antitoxin system